jgi:hypothetical protein
VLTLGAEAPDRWLELARPQTPRERTEPYARDAERTLNKTRSRTFRAPVAVGVLANVVQGRHAWFCGRRQWPSYCGEFLDLRIARPDCVGYVPPCLEGLVAKRDRIRSHVPSTRRYAFERVETTAARVYSGLSVRFANTATAITNSAGSTGFARCIWNPH